MRLFVCLLCLVCALGCEDRSHRSETVFVRMSDTGMHFGRVVDVKTVDTVTFITYRSYHTPVYSTGSAITGETDLKPGDRVHVRNYHMRGAPSYFKIAVKSSN